MTVNSDPIKGDVCVVGAGPVGMVLAMDLASRGNDVVVIEQRTDDEPPSAKCNTISVRTMEIMRRLGIADEVRRTQGLPDDYPTDAVYATRFSGFELTRFVMPSRRDRFNDHGYVDGDMPSAERTCHLNQIYLEPVLRAHLRNDFPNVRYLGNTRYESLQEHEGHGVVVKASSLGDDQQVEVRARYVVGCDGGFSPVRHHLGFRLRGDDNLVRARSRLFRSPGLAALCGYPRAWMNFFAVDASWSAMAAIDGRELWRFHYFLPPGTSYEDLDMDKEMRRGLGVGDEFSYTTVRDEDWIGRRLVADKFRAGRVFLCGDSAHLWVPYGGYGMNAGIADAANLSWMLDAVLQGWAPPALLDAYEAERRPVTEQVSRFAATFVDFLKDNELAVMEDDTDEGSRVRQAFGERLHQSNKPVVVPRGLNFGYAYEDSPIVIHDGEQAPSFTMGDYEPSTVPGARVPHFFLPDGVALYDALGPGFTLLRLDPDVNVEPLLRAAQDRSVPVEVLDIKATDETSRLGYRHPLVLARPDQHIAWRGTAVPDDPGALVDQVRGLTTSPGRNQGGMAFG